LIVSCYCYLINMKILLDVLLLLLQILLKKKRDDVCGRLVSGGIVRSLIVLVKSDTAQIVRESSRLLCNLALTLGKKLLDDDLPKILNVFVFC